MQRPGGYWWQCKTDKSHIAESFAAATGGVGLVKFFFDLAVSDWDQTQLIKPCTICSAGEMRITYEFPGAGDYTISVYHIVGLTNYLSDGFLPMMWETRAEGDPNPWFDFKFVKRRTPQGGFMAFGLSRGPVAFYQSELASLFATYCRKTRCTTFP